MRPTPTFAPDGLTSRGERDRFSMSETHRLPTNGMADREQFYGRAASTEPHDDGLVHNHNWAVRTH